MPSSACCWPRRARCLPSRPCSSPNSSCGRVSSSICSIILPSRTTYSLPPCRNQRQAGPKSLRYLRATSRSASPPCMVAPRSPRTTTHESSAEKAAGASSTRAARSLVIRLLTSERAGLFRGANQRRQRAPHRGEQRLGREGLLHERLAGQLARGVRHLAVRREEDDPWPEAERAHGSQERAPVHVGHAQVEDDHVGRLGLHLDQRGPAASRPVGFE